MENRIIIIILSMLLAIGIVAWRFVYLKNSLSMSGHLVFGVDLNLNQSNINSNLEPLLGIINQGNLTAIRTGINWGTLEPSPNVYNWKPLDTLMTKINSHKLIIILDLGQTPQWDLPSNANGNTHYPPADCMNGNNCNSIRSFITALAKHINSQSNEIYIIPRNEPQNTSSNWTDGTPQEYAGFIQATYQTAHNTGHLLKILNGGEEIYPTILRQKILSFDPNRKNGFSFEESLYSSPNFCESIDILDIHVGSMGPIYSPQIANTSESEIEQCNGGKYIPIWVTEVSFSSDPMAQKDIQYTSILGDQYINGDKSQGEFLMDTYKSLIENKYIIGINWENLIDSPNPYLKLNKGLGLLDSRMDEKLGFMTLKSIATQYGHS